MTRISISGIHNYSNYPFLILKISQLYAKLPHKIMQTIGWNENKKSKLFLVYLGT